MNAQSEAMKYFDALTENVDRLTQLFAEGLNEIGNRTETESIKNTAENGGVKFEQRNKEIYNYSKTFSEQIDDFINGTFPKYDTFIVCETPNIFKKIGLNSLPITYTTSHLKDILNKIDDDHSFTLSQMKSLPNALNNPIAIIKSRSKSAKNNSVVAIIDMPHNRKETIAAVVVDGTGTMQGNTIDSNAITSVHSRKNTINGLLKNAVDDELNGNGGIFYWNKNKAIQLLKSSGVQFPSHNSITDGFIRSISDSLSNVNKKIGGQTETKQFLQWFGDWINHPKTINPALLNADGTPKILYHQTGNDFTVFDLNREGAGTYDDETPIGIFLKDSDSDIGLRGKKQMALYASMKNPLVVNDRAELIKHLRQNVDFKDVNDLRIQTDKEYKEKFEKAKTEFVDFLTNWRKENPDAKRSDIYNDPEFEKVFEAEDNITSEWHEKINDISVEAKRIITDILKNEGYDGVIMKNDVGSFGRKTSAYIVFNENQVKSATDNIGTFSSDNNDIRYSDRDVELKKQYEKINRQLERENSQLREDVKNLRELNRLQGKVTGGKVFKGTSIQSVGRQTNLINRIVTAICVII